MRTLYAYVLIAILSWVGAASSQSIVLGLSKQEIGITAFFDGSEILIDQKNENPRKLTPLEAARLQGFPDQLVINAKSAGVSDVQLYKQFGNSVAVNVIRHIAKEMTQALLSKTEQKIAA